MRVATLLAMLFCATTLAAGEQSPSEARLEHCLVSLIDDVQIPAQEAGVLVELDVHEGQQVKTGDKLARLNDTPSQLQRLVALAERQVSAEKAANDVNVRYAEATRQVAMSEYQLNKEANAKVAGTKSAVELQKLLLTVEQAALQIEQARHEQKLASLETEANTAKVDLADDEIARRQIRAPLDGEVVEVMLRAGEWVTPGDPVLRVIRMDRLRVEAFVNASHLSPGEVNGKPVTVVVKLERGHSATFEGRIVFVDPRVQSGGDYRLWAEVENRKEAGQWLMRPGLQAEMSIALTPES
jgi:macrolide-specific efflux system membrane fusion protein